MIMDLNFLCPLLVVLIFLRVICGKGLATFFFLIWTRFRRYRKSHVRCKADLELGIVCRLRHCTSCFSVLLGN